MINLRLLASGGACQLCSNSLLFLSRKHLSYERRHFYANKTKTQGALKETELPKGPFRTKNSTALESVLFCHRRYFFSVHTVFLPVPLEK